MCNGVVAVCNWKTRYDINDNTVNGKDLRTEELMIIGVQGSFLESGDSGCKGKRTLQRCLPFKAREDDRALVMAKEIPTITRVSKYRFV